MPRIPRVRGLQSFQIASASSKTLPRLPFSATRTLSTTAPVCDLRSKLWKGPAPGPEDPYTQRPEPEEPLSNLPEEAISIPRHPRSVAKWRLPLPPKRTEATTEKELAANDPTYTPALTIEELEEIPPFNKWWDQPEHWGKESEFRSFGKAEKEVERTIIEVQVRRAVVEVLSLQQENKLAEQLVKRWPEGSREALEQTLAVEIVGEDGQFSLQGDVSSVVSHLTQDAAGSSEEGSPSITLEEAAEITKKWDAKWKEIKVNDEIKFAIRKRIYQLTGNLIPDSKLGAARNVRDVLTTLFQQRKPSSLADELLAKPEVTKLPNVRVHSRKVGPIDKEIEIGRWKIIEEELKKRDLPVTGTDNLSGNKEREWMRGKM
ncbi:unnamed protein product [Clonostachys rhizophaga]|uniref:Large ribosomal subunit protein mL50 n=1 Tax=Clonostachys rhizophaga TaxID=160324 RepID=A0A9N9YB46_9HYPO|nr:unnamed protein product [Clonostachys rhizophaga]